MKPTQSTVSELMNHSLPTFSESLNVVLILGRSQSGKSYLSNFILSKYQGPVYVLNCLQPEEVVNSKFQPIAWETAEKTLKNCAVLCEDLITLTQANFETLKFLTCYANHHRLVDPAIFVR